MSASLKDKAVGKVCVPIVETTVEKAVIAVKKAERWADLVELRADYLKKIMLPPFLENRRKPLIVTHRRKREGGRFVGGEKKRLAVLRDAVDLGADYIDVEFSSEKSSLQGFLVNKGRTQVILSLHDFRRTPSPKELRGLLGQMARLEADVVKIVSLARRWEDNLVILSLIPFARARNQRIIAFCMGDKGKVSRLFSPLLGAAWTYASLNREKPSAPGQLTAAEMKEMWQILNR
jgi:3-dehydroquinate dehydratase type I